MRKALITLALLLAFVSSGYGQGTGPITVKEADGSPSYTGIRTFIFDNGTVTISANTARIAGGGGGGSGTVTTFSCVTANGVSCSVATATTTPAITLTLGAITPSTIVATSTISATTGFKIGGAAASRKILVGDGTNFVASTETYAVPGTSGNLLTSDGTNWTSAAPAAGGIVINSTTITGTSGRVPYNNGGVVGETVGATSNGAILSLTTPNIITSLNDTNGNEIFKITATASAVNEVTFANAATGVNPLLTASGGDSNVGIDYLMKGTGTFNLTGNATQAAQLRLYEDTDDGTNYTAFRVGTQAGNVTYTLPTADGSNTNVLQTNGSGVLSWVAAGGGGGATTALDNLASVSINTSLLAQTGVDLGSTTKPFRDLYLFGAGTYSTTYLKLTGTPTSTRTVTFPDASITVARTDAAQTFTGLQTFSTSPTSVGAGALSERFGNGASTASNTVAVAFGNSAAVSNTGGTAIGYSAAAASGTAIGRDAVAADNEFVSGSSNLPINNLYFGKGKTSTTATAFTINGTGGSGTDNAAAAVNIAGGAGTGTGAGGSVVLQVAPAGSTGSSANALVAGLTVNSAVHVIHGGSAPTVGGSCGTSPSIAGTDSAGKLTTGTVAPTSCTITFNKAWTTAPSCFSQNETTANLVKAVSTTTTLTVSGTFVASDVLSYACIGY